MKKSLALIMTLVVFSLFIKLDYVLAYDKLLGTFQLEIEDAVSPENAFNAIYAASMLNETIIDTTQIFSFNETIGQRTPERGFIRGIISSRSKYPIYDWGGGICMSSSILHQAVKTANLTILERHNHVADVGYLPLGQDAAITWGVEDYRFFNNRPHPLVIKSYIDSEIIKISVYERLPSPVIYIDNIELFFVNKPFIDEGITYVEVDETLENLKIPSGEKEILLSEIRNSILTSYTYENKLFLPLRIIADLLDFEISWNGEKGEVRLGSYLD